MQLSTCTTYTLELPEVTFTPEGPPPDPHSEDIECVEDDYAGATWRVSWLVADDDAFDYDIPEGFEFREFRSEEDRDKFIEEALEVNGAIQFVIVDRYEHGLVHYSPRFTHFYPDREWDVAPSGVLIVPNDIPPEQVTDAATAVLDEYSSWCNGDVWGVVRNWVTEDGTVVADNACWGYVGHDYALRAMRENW